MSEEGRERGRKGIKSKKNSGRVYVLHTATLAMHFLCVDSFKIYICRLKLYGWHKIMTLPTFVRAYFFPTD